MGVSQLPIRPEARQLVVDALEHAQGYDGDIEAQWGWLWEGRGPILILRGERETLDLIVQTLGRLGLLAGDNTWPRALPTKS